MIAREALVAAFRAEYGRAPTATGLAPGRVNLIGEHTDYEGGLVLPVPATLGLGVALGAREDDRVRARSAARPEAVASTLGGEHPEWVRFVLAVRDGARAAGLAVPERGLDVLVAGDLPEGRGLSSSAALALATLAALEAAAGRTLPHRDAAILARDAEEAALGTPCGLLDQLAIRGAKPGRAALVDCGSGARREIPLPPDLAILVVDSGEERHLAATGYADRVTECRTAAELLARRAGRPGLRLGAAEPDLLAHFGESPEEATLLRRARHVIGETARVREAAAALEAEDLEALGRLVRASHASLAGDFEVSTPRLDAIVAHATRHAGCLGARLLGAGFGGSVLVLGRVGRLAGLREHLEAIAPRQAQILVAPVGAA